jgi:hypothetical protein
MFDCLQIGELRKSWKYRIVRFFSVQRHNSRRVRQRIILLKKDTRLDITIKFYY